MTVATINKKDFPSHYRSEIYPAWLMGRLWEQGIKFTPGLRDLVFSVDDVQEHIAPPWRMEQNYDDGVITVWQGDKGVPT